MWSQSFTQTALATSLSLLLAACGGGSSTGAATPSNANVESTTNDNSNSSTGTSTGEIDTTTGNETTTETPTDANATDASGSEATTQAPGNANAPDDSTTGTTNGTATDANATDTNATDASNNPVDNTVTVDGNLIDINKLRAIEAELTNTPLMTLVKASIETRDNSIVEQISAGSPNNPANVMRIESILSAADWDYVFPKRSPEYSYDNFLKAAGKFVAFCGDYDDGRNAEAICRKSLATMFAHFTQETGGHTAYWDVEQWRQGLVHVREMGWNEEMRGGYNGECLATTWQGQTWPCGTYADGEFKSYFGRGAKQLSYNYNYGPFSEAMFGDVRVLLDNPELVADTWLNLASAVFFFVYPQPPKPSMLHVIDGTWQPNAADISNKLTPGFGVTTQIINGGVECGGSVEVQQSVNRIDYYQNFARQLGVVVESNEVLGCMGMKQFDEAGDGALKIYWEQDWSFNANNPDGMSFACQLVGYQTPFSVFKGGDYIQCVEYYFNVTATDDLIVPDSSTTDGASTAAANDSTAGVNEWLAGSIYNSGDTAQWNGITYQAMWWNQGAQPDQNSGEGQPWQAL